jgi:hypothetical protein
VKFLSNSNKSEKLKIALCFSGQPRFIETAYPMIRKYILEEYETDANRCIDSISPYNILLCDSKDKINIMIKFFKIFIEKQNKNPTIKHFIGCDFEFNRVQKLSKDIALFQINLEDDTNEGTIFIFYPPELNKEDCTTLIKLLTDPYIIKILHGGESLDIPYLLNQLLENDTELIKKFFDTEVNKEFDWSVEVIDTGLESETGGRILNASKITDLGENFFLTYGDTLADIDLKSLFNFYVENRFSSVLTGTKPVSRFGKLILNQNYRN